MAGSSQQIWPGVDFRELLLSFEGYRDNDFKRGTYYAVIRDPHF